MLIASPTRRTRPLVLEPGPSDGVCQKLRHALGCHPFVKTMPIAVATPAPTRR